MITLAGKCGGVVLGLLGLLGGLWLGGCAPAKVTSTWRDPSLTGPLQFKKIAVFCIHPSPAICRVVEDEMVKQVGPGRAVAGYSIVTAEDRKSVDAVKARLQQQGFDGAVTLKLAGSHTERASEGPEIRTFYQDYDRNVAAMDAADGGTATRVVVSVQTSIYNVTDAKLIWQGTVDLYDPHDAEQITADIAKVIGDELRKEKLL